MLKWGWSGWSGSCAIVCALCVIAVVMSLGRFGVGRPIIFEGACVI